LDLLEWAGQTYKERIVDTAFESLMNGGKKSDFGSLGTKRKERKRWPTRGQKNRNLAARRGREKLRN